MGTTHLFFTASVEEQWRSIAGPWLREHAAAAWRNPAPTVVLTPSRAESFYLRSRLVAEGIPFLGLRFWTPSDTRQFLLGELSPETCAATDAELRFIARSCAERLGSELKAAATRSLIQGTVTSVAQEPAPFLRAYDLLLAAGWDPARTGSAYGTALAERMGRDLAQYRVATQAGVHRELFRLASVRMQPIIRNLLILGFNATHWPLWDLLHAALFCAGQTTVALSEPRVFGEEVDQLWISSWEEVTGAEALVPESSGAETIDGPFTGLISFYEKGEPGQMETGSDLSFLVAPDLASQARAITLQALDYLQRDTCTRLGIVFAEANALSLEVAAQLRRFSIPLDDGTGAIRPGLFERRSWQAWLALQENPSVQRLMAWLRACEAQGISFGNIEVPFSARRAADLLENALGETLVDDLDFLTRHLEENGTGHAAHELAALLRQRIKLPQEATFEKFLALTRQAMALPGWEECLALLQVAPPGWLLKNKRLISRRTFLGWLRETADSRERTRGADGNHFYGKVHLLIYAQMTGQTWSHLILTGLNEGVWPRVFEAEAFGSRHELAALNQKARTLNQLATGQGGQGQGHETVQSGRGHCLLPLERQELALRDLCAALEGTSHAVSLAAMTTEAGRTLLPSDFFSHAWQTSTDRALDEETFRLLANTTFEWCHRHDHLFASPVPDVASPTIEPMLNAYHARRDASRPFGPFEFAFREAPEQPIQLSCKTWETAWNHPASVWLEKVVGVAPWPEGTLSWQRAVGTWVHRWLMSALRLCRERNSLDDFPTLLQEAAKLEEFQVRNRARASGLKLYPWWDHVCGQARSIAVGLGETLFPHLNEGRFLSEFTLPGNLLVALPGTKKADFALTGRIDLLLFQPETFLSDPASGDFSDCFCWVIDFKTGSAQNLSYKKIEKGMGLQAVLYALAVRARGAKTIAISLHTRDTPLERQAVLTEVLEMKGLFRSLNILHRSGIFGMRGDAQNDYGYSPLYPMATRLIPKNVLDTKWALVHGSGPSEQEGDE